MSTATGPQAEEKRPGGRGRPPPNGLPASGAFGLEGDRPRPSKSVKTGVPVQPLS